MSDAEVGTDAQMGNEDAASTSSNDEQANDRYGELPEDIRQLIRQKDSEAAKYRKQLRAAEGKLSEYEQSQLTEQERQQQYVRELEEKLNKAEQQARSASVKADISASATKLGFRNPKVAHRLVDLNAVEFDDSGDPVNVEDLLREVLQDNPYLANTGSADGGQGRTAAEQESMNDRIRHALRK